MHETKPAYVVLLGHWDHSGMGCDSNMTVPAIYAEISNFEGCSIGDRLKHLDVFGLVELTETKRHGFRSNDAHG